MATCAERVDSELQYMIPATPLLTANLLRKICFSELQLIARHSHTAASR